MNDPVERAVAYAALRAAERPVFMAYLVAAYRRFLGVTADAVAEELGVGMCTVHRLALCRRPPADPQDARVAILRIAEAFDVDATRLAHFVRTSETILKLENVDAGDRWSGMLMAARDRLLRDAGDVRLGD